MKKARISIGIGMPAYLKRELFAHVLLDAFDGEPYLVGSALKGKTWRDVDVRLMLDDAAYTALLGKVTHPNGKLDAFNLAFSVLGTNMTGLPIDFQLQHQDDANKKFPHQPRSALGITSCRIKP